MTYVENENYIKCKLTDCDKVCNVDWFYEGENMLVINPDECIECNINEPERQINTIEQDTNQNTEKLVILNKKLSAKWKNIKKKKNPQQEADQIKKKQNKLEKKIRNKHKQSNK